MQKVVLLVMKSDISQSETILIKTPACLRFTDVDAYFIEENENKYLIFALTESNRGEILGPYRKLCNKI